jgi:hypothetical protein
MKPGFWTRIISVRFEREAHGERLQEIACRVVCVYVSYPTVLNGFHCSVRRSG